MSEHKGGHTGNETHPVCENRVASHDLHEEIAGRAYRLFRERGGSDGHADEDLIQAEREVHREKGQA